MTFEPLTDEQIEQALSRTSAAAKAWSRTTFEERAALMRRGADILEGDADEVARLITVEMGKPIAASRGEVLKSAATMRFYTEKASEFLAEEELGTPGNVNAKRFIVHSGVYGAFLARFTAKLADLTVGDPLDESTDLGPLATEGGVDDIVELVEDARNQGARIVLGGDRPDREGWFYPATVVDRLPQSARLFREEAFGPLASVFEVSSAEEAIAMANDSEFGLGSAAWTTDEDEVTAFIEGLQAGTVNINGMTVSYP